MHMIEAQSCRLYLITPAAFEPKTFAETLKRALDAGDVASLQIRLKPADDDAVRRAVEALMPVAHARNVAVLVNDRADIAAEMGCDGAHIGQEDMPYKEARRLLGPDRIVGVTCHASRHLAMIAGEEGARLRGLRRVLSHQDERAQRPRRARDSHLVVGVFRDSLRRGGRHHDGKRRRSRAGGCRFSGRLFGSLEFRAKDPLRPSRRLTK